LNQSVNAGSLNIGGGGSKAVLLPSPQMLADVVTNY